MDPTVTLEDIAREAGLLILPPGGAWVCIKGCPAWPRGQRLIRPHKELGIQHLDILWGCSEKLTIIPPDGRHARGERNLAQQVMWEVGRGEDISDAMACAAEHLVDYIRGDPLQTVHQTSLITVSYPAPEAVKFYNGELSVFTSDLIRKPLEANWIETHIFGQTMIPILEEAIRDVVDAFEMDGLSKSEAYHQAYTAGVIEPEQMQPFVPQWFYRPIGEFRDTFVEEENESTS